MAKCGFCKSSIVFGGKTVGGERYCGDDCARKGVLMTLGRQVPPAVVRDEVLRIHRSNCPKCNGPGPVDLHSTYQVWSMLILTSWKTNCHLCCRRCATKAAVGDAVLSGIIGWWGIPWGLVVTPIQICRNIATATKSPSEHPSEALESLALMVLGDRLAQNPKAFAAQQGPSPPPLPPMAPPS